MQFNKFHEERLTGTPKEDYVVKCVSHRSCRCELHLSDFRNHKKNGNQGILQKNKHLSDFRNHNKNEHITKRQ